VQDGGAARLGVSCAVPLRGSRHEGAIGAREGCFGKAANPPARDAAAVGRRAAGWAFAGGPLTAVPAFALDGGLDPAVSGVTVASLVLTLVALAALAALARRLHGVQREAAQGARERDAPGRRPRRARGASRRRARGRLPLAARRWQRDLSPGLLANLRFEGPPRFADLARAAGARGHHVPRRRGRGAARPRHAFALTLDRKGRGAVDAIGRRICDAGGQAVADVVWIADGGRRAAALAETASLAAEQVRLRAALTRCRCRSGGAAATIWCSSTATPPMPAAVDAPPAVVVAEGREIAAGVLPARGRALAERARATQVAQSESQHIVVNGSRRLVEFTEAPLPGDGGLICYARDFTDLENVQAELARHIAAHADVLENVATAIAIYGPRHAAQILQHRLQHAVAARGGVAGHRAHSREVPRAPARAAAHPEYADFPCLQEAAARHVHLAHRAG